MMLNKIISSLNNEYEESYLAKFIVMHRREFKYDEQEGRFVADVGIAMPEIDTAFSNVRVYVKETKIYLWLEVV